MKDYKIAFLLPAYMGSNHSLFLGIAYLVAVVKKRENDAIVIDEDAVKWLYKSKDEISSLKLAENRVIHELNKYSPDVICLYVNTANYRNALRVLKYVRKEFPGIYMVVGGPHISTCYNTFREWHKDLFDAAIIGEGENSLCELIDNVKQGKLFESIPGILYSKYCSELIKGKMVEIDTIPFPDRQAFFHIYNYEEKKVAEESYQRVFYSSLPGFENGHARIVASRGCYNNCTFCSPGMYWRNPETNKPCRRIRKAKYIVDEIETLLIGGVGAIYFDDPTFPIKSDLNFFNELEKEILDRQLKFHWGAPICITEINNNILDRLQKIGFSYTYFGLENYKEDNLKNFHKQQNIKSCLEIIKECKKRGIHCDASYQIGLPNESIDDMKKSIDWIFQNGIERNTFYSITAIWPETIMAKKYGVLAQCYEPDYIKETFEKKSGLYFYEQGNPVIEQFYSNCSETYHFIPMNIAVEMKYYVFDKGLTNRFAKEKRIINEPE